MPLFAEGKKDVFVGKIRKSLNNSKELNLWLSCDNLIKGAAYNALQILESMIKKDLISWAKDKMMKDLGRLITAMVTPFKDNGDVDYERAKEFAKALVDTGSDGLLIGGTTGESPSMNEDEKLQLFKSVKGSCWGYSIGYSRNN